MKRVKLSPDDTVKKKPRSTKRRTATRSTSAVSGRPSIIISDRQLRDTTTDAAKALAASTWPPVIFQHGGVLARIRHDHRGPAIEVMNDAVVRGRLARAADWYRVTLSGMVATYPPMPVVRDMVALPAIPGVPA